MSCSEDSPTTSKPLGDSPTKLCVGAPASGVTSPKVPLTQEDAPSEGSKSDSFLKKFKALIQKQAQLETAKVLSFPTGASVASTGTLVTQGVTSGGGAGSTGILGPFTPGQLIGTNAWPNAAPYPQYNPGPSLEDLINGTKKADQLEAIYRAVQTQIEAEKHAAKIRLARMSKIDLAREALKELTQMRERLDVLTSALTVLVLEQDETEAAK